MAVEQHVIKLKLEVSPMSKYSTTPLLFSPILHKKVEADFGGGEITSNAGALLLRETEKQTGIISALTSVISDTRDLRYVDHSILDIITQRVNQIACGYEDANDSDSLRSDPALKTAAGRLPITGADLASQPTVSRLENAVRRSDLVRMGYAIVDNFISSYAVPPALIILDFDDTEDKTHGQQQLTLFNNYYDSHCYLPLHVYEGISGKLIASVLRPGKRPTGKQVVAILKRIVKKIRATWPDTIILFRGDSHFCSPEVLRYCDKLRLFYTIGLCGNAVLNRLIEPLMACARAVFAQAQLPTRLYESFSYKAQTWDAPQRVVAKAEVNTKGDNPRFVVTNLTEPDDTTVYKYLYCGRGQMENYIKNHKIYTKSDRTSCHKFTANQFRLYLHSAVYVLLHAFRENVLRGTQFACAQFDIIRLNLLKIGAHIRELKTKISLHLPSSCPYKPILSKIAALFQTLPATLSQLRC
jgi:hypothetical protein